MQFTLSRSSVQIIVSTLLKTCNTKGDKSSLDGHLYFEVIDDSGSLNLMASTTNGTADQTSLIPTISLDASAGEGFFVEASIFSEFMKNFGHEDISAKLLGKPGSESELIIGSKAKNTYLTLPIKSKDNYVPVHFVKSGVSFEIKGAVLAHVLKMTAFSAAPDHRLPAINAVKLNISGTEITALSCDNFRVSRCVAKTDDTGVTSEFLVPRVSAEILSSLLSNVDIVSIQSGRNHLRFSWGDSVFTTVLEASGKKYPSIDKFFDATLISTVVLSRGELVSALKVTGLIAKDTSVSLDVLDKGAGLMISASQRTGGSTEITVVVQESDAAADSIVAFKYLKTAVDMISDPFVKIQFRSLENDVLAPIFVDEHGFEHMIFPVEPNDGNDENNDGESDGDE